MIDISHLTTKGKMIFLACDQGMERGPSDYNEKTIDPRYIFEIGVKAGFNAMIFGKGIAEKYYKEYQNRIPLIIKLNGHSQYNRPTNWGAQNCEVDEAIALGGAAVGYTIHLGSVNEAEMFREFGKIVREAHARGIPVIGWVYPRGPEIPNPHAPDVTAYAARVGLELGADIVNVYNPGDIGALRWVGLSAGKAKVIISGGEHVAPEVYAEEVRSIMRAGLAGVAVGRNIWQADDPSAVAEIVKDIIYNGKY